jgi:hypothetical protein
VVAPAQNGFALLTRKKTSERQTARYALCKAHNIRFNTRLLIGKPRAAPSNPRLHLVNQQQPVTLLTQFGHGFKVISVQRQYAALALNDLQHNGAHTVLHFL